MNIRYELNGRENIILVQDTEVFATMADLRSQGADNISVSAL